MISVSKFEWMYGRIALEWFGGRGEEVGVTLGRWRGEDDDLSASEILMPDVLADFMALARSRNMRHFFVPAKWSSFLQLGHFFLPPQLMLELCWPEQ